jgi:hypothetical protein
MIRELERRLETCEREETEEVAGRHDHADDHRMAV